MQYVLPVCSPNVFSVPQEGLIFKILFKCIFSQWRNDLRHAKIDKSLLLLQELVFSTVYSKRSTLNLFQVFEDAACEREVLNLRVKCPSQGCHWTGELRNVKVKREVNLLKAKLVDKFFFVL